DVGDRFGEHVAEVTAGLVDLGLDATDQLALSDGSALMDAVVAEGVHPVAGLEDDDLRPGDRYQLPSRFVELRFRPDQILRHQRSIRSCLAINSHRSAVAGRSTPRRTSAGR